MGYRAGYTLLADGLAYNDVVEGAADWPSLIDCVNTGVLVPESVEDIPEGAFPLAVESHMSEFANGLVRNGLPVPAGLLRYTDQPVEVDEPKPAKAPAKKATAKKPAAEDAPKEA
jgi:hypothetical protein